MSETQFNILMTMRQKNCDFIKIQLIQLLVHPNVYLFIFKLTLKLTI